MVTASELGSMPMQIESFAFSVGPGSDAVGQYDDLTVLMGHTDLVDLTTTFDDNWKTSGTQVLFDPEKVFTGVAVDDWIVFDLDTDFQYDGASNLLIELLWNGPTPPLGEGSIYTWTWGAPSIRTVTSTDINSPTGTAWNITQQLRVDYTPQSLEQTTFGGIKASF